VGQSIAKRTDVMLNEFPVIHTNIWDVFLAVPIILLVVILLRVLFKLPEVWFSTVATVTGLTLSIFISHRVDFAAGTFMGFYYGAAAVGTIYSAKLTFMAYRRRR